MAVGPWGLDWLQADARKALGEQREKLARARRAADKLQRALRASNGLDPAPPRQPTLRAAGAGDAPGGEAGDGASSSGGGGGDLADAPREAVQETPQVRRLCLWKAWCCLTAGDSNGVQCVLGRRWGLC